jgi:hypothetical protein
MIRSLRVAAVAVALSTSAYALPAQAPAPKGALPTTAPVMLSLMRAADGVHMKMVALAKAFPADKYDWRPGPGVRSVREVMLHIASENYLLPAMAGTAAPAATKINAKDFASAEAFEKRPLSRDSVVAELDRSFAHLSNAMGKTATAGLTTTVSMFGQNMPAQDLWIGTTTHLHEHLGQAIAYARMNKITPPWSK